MVRNVRRAEHVELELSEDDAAEPPPGPGSDAESSATDEPPPRKIRPKRNIEDGLLPDRRPTKRRRMRPTKRRRINSGLCPAGFDSFATAPKWLQKQLGPGFSEAFYAPLDDSAGSWLLLLPKFLPGRENFETLWAKHPPTLGKGKLFGKKVNFQRYQQSFGADYAFSGQVAEAQPLNEEAAPEVWHVLSALRQTLSTASMPLKKHTYGACLVNWYDGGRHSIGYHSDNEKGLVPGAPIFAVSWGARRLFRIAPKDGPSSEIFKKVEVDLEDGDLIVMGGACQRTHKHAVPQSVMRHGRRISLTFRCFQKQQTEEQTE